MSVSGVILPERKRIEYPIPSSTIRLEIALRESQVVERQDVNACLSGAVDQARKEDQTSLLEGAWRYYSPLPPHLGFCITGTLWGNSLTWSDVVAVLQALQTFYAGRSEIVTLRIDLTDEKRGILGDATTTQTPKELLFGKAQVNPAGQIVEAETKRN